MKKLISIVLIICLMLIGSYFYIESKNNQQISEVMLNLFSIKTYHNFKIKVPDSEKNTECIFKKFDKENLICQYTEDYEKGTIKLDYKKIYALKGYSNDTFYFAAPFIISNQGSGIFYYIGTFKLNVKTGELQHLKSYFIGDRILIERFEQNTSDSLQVYIKDRKASDSMSTKPQIQKIINLKL